MRIGIGISITMPQAVAGGPVVPPPILTISGIPLTVGGINLTLGA